MSNKLPFTRALLYIAIVKCRINFDQPDLIEFMRHLSEVFPFSCVDSPFSVVKKAFYSLNNIQHSIATGNYSEAALEKFLFNSDLQSLHEAYDSRDFQDILYDIDIRQKIDGMAITNFRLYEIEAEVKNKYPQLDDALIKLYIKYFADYNDMNSNERYNYVVHCFEDSNEQKLFLRCLENKSKDVIRVYLNIKTKIYTPVDIANRAAQIIEYQTQNSLIDRDHERLNSYLKLGLKVADALHKFGAGNKDAVEELLGALSRPEGAVTNSPKPMTVDQLEDLYLQRVHQTIPSVEMETL